MRSITPEMLTVREDGGAFYRHDEDCIQVLVFPSGSESGWSIHYLSGNIEGEEGLKGPNLRGCLPTDQRLLDLVNEYLNLKVLPASPRTFWERLGEVF